MIKRFVLDRQDQTQASDDLPLAIYDKIQSNYDKNGYCTYPDKQLDKSYDDSKRLKHVKDGAEIICLVKMFQQLSMRIEK